MSSGISGFTFIAIETSETYIIPSLFLLSMPVGIFDLTNAFISFILK